MLRNLQQHLMLSQFEPYLCYPSRSYTLSFQGEEGEKTRDLFNQSERFIS